jgi:hypothetical protein
MEPGEDGDDWQSVDRYSVPAYRWKIASSKRAKLRSTLSEPVRKRNKNLITRLGNQHRSVTSLAGYFHSGGSAIDGHFQL